MRYLTRAGACCLALAQLACGGAPAPRNLVLVTLDTTRADALTPYGQALPASPSIARMAAEGVLFGQVAASSPSTLPSHASILTGLHPFEHGVRANAGYRLPETQTTLAERLRDAGFRTGAEIAAPVLDADKGLAQGFERYHDLRAGDVERITTRSAAPGGKEVVLDERPAEDVTRAALRFIGAQGREPFFLWAHYFDPHLFHVHRPAIAERVGGDGYLAEVLYTDTWIGALLDHLEARGLRERTLVILVADHGEGLGEHGESTHSFFVYESTIRVPLILWGPRALPAGRRVAALVRTIDILPTALDWLGLPAPEDVSGESVLPLALGEGVDPGLAAYGESIEFARFFGTAPVRFLRRGSWKYVHHDAPELYDLAADPGERRDLASQHPERVAALRAELEGLLAGGRAAEAVATLVSPAERDRLSSRLPRARPPRAIPRPRAAPRGPAPGR